MPYALGRCAAVGQLIKQRFGIDLPGRKMELHLRHWSFTHTTLQLVDATASHL